MTQDNLHPSPSIQNFSVMPAPLNTTKVVIQIYGWFLMIIGVVMTLVVFSMGLFALFQGDPDGVAAGIALICAGVFFIIFFGGVGFFALKAAKAIQERKNWGKIFGIVMGVFIVAQFPIGTLAAVFIFIGLFSKESEGWFIN
ncbi:hypothetical protein KAU33_01845 [Candidatus Dependentiae bacterium]|nr:hypothetical protein [Candidatus Dependentiae bacterium]